MSYFRSNIYIFVFKQKFFWNGPRNVARSEQAQNVLDVTDSDVLMLGAHFPQKLGRDPTHMVIIGRARVSKKWCTSVLCGVVLLVVR